MRPRVAGMTDFDEALRARLANNEAIAERRAAAEEEMARAEREQEEAARRQDQERRERHAQLAEHLVDVAGQLKASRPDSFIVRSGWTASGEEFVVKLSTRQMTPKRSLLVEVDRDDDEVLVRWTSGIGNAIEIWRLLDVTPGMLTELVLQVADDAAWDGRRPPPFPQRATS